MADKIKEEDLKINPEFLIFKIETNPKVNNSYKFLGIANSLIKATNMIKELNSSETGRIVVLEKKAYFERKPAITLDDLKENISVAE